jgi:hypothetical protein
MRRDDRCGMIVKGNTGEGEGGDDASWTDANLTEEKK